MPDFIPRPQPDLTERLLLHGDVAYAAKTEIDRLNDRLNDRLRRFGDDAYAAATEIDRLRSEVRRLTRELDEARAVLRDAERRLS